MIRVPLSGLSSPVWDVMTCAAGSGNDPRFAETLSNVRNRDCQRSAWCCSSNSHTVSGRLRVTSADADAVATNLCSIKTSKDTIVQDIELSIRLIDVLQSTNLPQ